MSSFDKETEGMLEVYLLETGQMMEKLDEILMRAEKEKMLGEEDVNSIFRIMHTTKSSSAFMKLDSLSDMAHRLEDLFSALRDDRSLMKDREQELFELLFEASDFIKGELENMRLDDYMPENIGGISERIEKYLGKTEDLCRKREEDQVNTAGTFEQREGTILKVWFEQNCRMENVRAFMLMKQLTNAIPEAACSPEHPERDSKLADDIRRGGLLVCVPAGQSAAAVKIVQGGLFVRKCEIVADNLPRKRKTDEDKGQARYGKEAEAKTSSVEKEFLNVRIDRLDDLQNLTGQLIMFFSSFKNEMEKKGHGDLKEMFERGTENILEELEDTVMNMCMVPIARIVPKLKRVLRDICQKQQKEVDFFIEGQDVEADKNIVDHLYEAAMHVLRNAVDHGIEAEDERVKAGKSKKGRITLAVESAGGELVVKISDDGRGMDEAKILQRAREKDVFTKPEEEYTHREILELCTLPGFSTNQAANQYSGRGVGMDIVRRAAEDAGGHLRIESDSEKGTAIIMNMPLTHTIIEGIRFYAGGQSFSVPAYQVCRFFENSDDNPDIKLQDGKKVLLFEDKILPIFDLSDLFGTGSRQKDADALMYVKGPSREGCFLVDKVLDRERIVLKPLPALFGGRFKESTGMNGCSVMGDGNICMSLNVETVLKLALKEEGLAKEDGHGAN